MKRAYFALTAGKHTWIITLQEQIEEFLSEQYFACKSWIKFLPNLVLMTLNNLSSRKLKSVFALWCIRLPILIYYSHFLYFLCGLFTRVCVICLYILLWFYKVEFLPFWRLMNRKYSSVLPFLCWSAVLLLKLLYFLRGRKQSFFCCSVFLTRIIRLFG